MCLVAPEFIPLWGGTGSYGVQLVQNLPKEMEIHVVTLRRVLRSSNNDDVVGQPDLIPSLTDNIHVHYISTANDTFFYNLGFQLSCLREIPKLHHKYNFSIIHSHHCHMPDILLQLMHTLRIPTITTVHNMFMWMKTAISFDTTKDPRQDQFLQGSHAVMHFRSIQRKP